MLCEGKISTLEVMANNGLPSNLFQQILKLYNGNKELALSAYLKFKEPSFISTYTGELDSNEELILSDNGYLEVEGNKMYVLQRSIPLNPKTDYEKMLENIKKSLADLRQVLTYENKINKKLKINQVENEIDTNFDSESSAPKDNEDFVTTLDELTEAFNNADTISNLLNYITYAHEELKVLVQELKFLENEYNTHGKSKQALKYIIDQLHTIKNKQQALSIALEIASFYNDPKNQNKEIVNEDGTKENAKVKLNADFKKIIEFKLANSNLTPEQETEYANVYLNANTPFELILTQIMIVSNSLDTYHSYLSKEVLASDLINTSDINEINQSRKELGQPELTKEELVKEMTEGDDVGLAASLFSLVNINDSALALFGKKFKRAFFGFDKDILFKRNKLDSLKKKLAKHLGVLESNFKVLYDDFIYEVTDYDEENNPITRLAYVEKYDYDKFRKEKYKNRQKLNEYEAKIKELSTKLDEIQNDPNHPDKKRISDYYAAINTLSTAKKQEKAKWIKENTGADNKSPNDNYINPKYLAIQNDPIKKEFYDYLMELVYENVNYLDQRQNFIKFVPSIEKSSAERLSNLNVIDAVKESFASYKERGQDLNASVLTNKTSKYSNEGMFKKIPIFYQEQMSADDVTRDIFTSTILNTAMANKRVLLYRLLPEVNLMQSVLAQKKYYAKDILGKRIVNKTYTTKGEVIETPKFKDETKDEIRSTKIFNDFTLLQFFSERTAETNKTLLMLENTLGRLTSMISLGLNIPSAVTNTIYGNIQNVLQADGSIITAEGIRKAQATYYSNIHKLAGSYLDSSSKQSLLTSIAELFDFRQGHARENLVATSSQIKKTGLDKLLLSANEMNEHNVAHTLGYSILYSQKVNDTELGEISLMEAFTQDEFGNAVIRDSVYVTPKLEKESDTDYDIRRRQELDEIQIKVRENIALKYKRSQGNFAKLDTPSQSRQVIYRIFMVFRKHIVEGMNSRFAGAQVDYESGKVIVGAYSSLYKEIFGVGMLDSFNKIKSQSLGTTATNITKDFLTLINPLESYDNIVALGRTLKKIWDNPEARRGFIEILGISILSSATLHLYAALKEGIDDEDEDSLGMMLFSFSELITLRVISQMQSFYSINDMYKNFENISVLFTTGKKFKDLFSQLMNGPFEQYTRDYGPYEKGDYKIAKKFADVVPGLNQIMKMQDLDMQISYFKNLRL